MKRAFGIVLAAFALVSSASIGPLTAPVSAVSSAALSIVPKKTYTIKPGKSVKDTLVIRNLDADRTLELSLRVVDFTFTDDGGAPKLMLEEDAPQTTWSLKPFLSVPKNVKIGPKGSKTLDMRVDIPSSQGAGSYYSAIVYSSTAPDGGNVGLSASGVTLVFTSIPGKVNEKLKLEQFGAYNEAKGNKKAGYSFINTNEPEIIAYTLKNEGNVTEAPVGSITVKHMFGREYTINNVNPNSSLALIGQSRTFSSCIKLDEQEVDFSGRKTKATTCASPGLWPGYYSANLNLFYGQNGNRTQELFGSASFWYLPWWFIFIVLVLLTVVGVYVWRTVHKVRKSMNGGGSRRRKPTRRRR